MKATHVVEAALFSAGRAISIQEIMDETELTKATVEKAVKQLAKDYSDRDTAIEISKAGAKWAMQVRTVVSEDAAKFAPMEIPKKVLKTLALIAYHQPIKQSELSEMIGSKVYDHIPELKERGLVKTRRDGQTKILSVTQAFPEYFGLDAANPDQIRAVMAKLVGIDPTKDKPRGLSTYEPPAVMPEPPAMMPAQPDPRTENADQSSAGGSKIDLDANATAEPAIEAKGDQAANAAEPDEPLATEVTTSN